MSKQETTQAVPRMTLTTAQATIEAARKKAEKLGVKMNIAVVDEGANLIAFLRMDGAWLGSIAIAQDKAYTSRAFDVATRELAAKSQPGKPLFGIGETHHGRVIIFGGGVPLKVGDVVVGAVGVSGGTPDQDHEVADAAADEHTRISTFLT